MFCPQCGNEVADDQKFCHHCGAKLSQETEKAAESAPPAESAPAVSGEEEKTPWEDREERGFFSGLFTTLNEVLFHPAAFYKKMPVTGGLADPLLFALIVGMVGLMFSYLWQMVMKGAMENVIPMAGMQVGANPIFQGIGLALLAFFSPFLIIIGLFVQAGILHVCLMMVKGANRGFEATFRVVAYGYSANIFMIIPVCGNLVAAAWAVVLYIIGLREAHLTTGGKASFAVFLPVIVCCGLLLFGIALFLGAAAGSLGAMMQMQQ
jgi:hypothetical protein